ncbi:hypothetical protein BD770DRAFT_449483 [Pilaira anomala]|nr:hypothetical protein BD770DRAFT_449483 [Pilaira anomala]
MIDSFAMECGVAIVLDTDVKDFIEKYGFPVIIKAAAMSSGRRQVMRAVRDLESFEVSFFNRVKSEGPVLKGYLSF